MKKYQLNFLVFVFVFSLFFSVNNKASAISGACSYHGGVSCGAGPDYDGSVICNDGWRDSSVGFYETSSCTSSSIPLCPYPIGIGCTTESAYSSMRAIWARSGYPDTMLSNLQECRSQIDQYNEQKQDYDACMNKLLYPPARTPSPTVITTPTPTPFINDWNYQNEQFDIDFSKTVYPVILEDFPNITPSKLKEIRDKVYRIAFTKDFVKVSISDIYKTIVKQMFLEPIKSPIVSSATEPLFTNLFSAPSTTPKPQSQNKKVVPSPSGKTDTVVRFTPTPHISPRSRLEQQVPIKNQDTLVKILKLIKRIKFW